MLEEQVNIEVVQLTPAAVNAVREILAEKNLMDHALRVFVSGSGCSGIQYGMTLEGNIREQDFTCEFEDVKVVVDEVSINYLRGSKIDYIDTPQGSGFQIDNPNAMSSCCGSSEDSSGGCGSGGCSGCG